MEQTEIKIRKFLKERFNEYREEIGPTDYLGGVVDSMGVFDLVTFLEEEFSINIPTEEFSLDLFSSIENIIKAIDEFK